MVSNGRERGTGRGTDWQEWRRKIEQERGAGSYKGETVVQFDSCETVIAKLHFFVFYVAFLAFYNGALLENEYLQLLSGGLEGGGIFMQQVCHGKNKETRLLCDCV